MSTRLIERVAATPPGGKWTSEKGAVAQLGEHLLCKQGVTGSIPVSSTIRHRKTTKGRFPSSLCRLRLARRGSLTIWNDPSIDARKSFDERRTVFSKLMSHVQTLWGYMVKRLSAYGGCLGGRRR